jgi:hypothetical protein
MIRRTAFALAIMLAAVGASAQNIAVVDGDTIKVDGVSWRLLDYDTPRPTSPSMTPSTTQASSQSRASDDPARQDHRAGHHRSPRALRARPGRPISTRTWGGLIAEGLAEA